MNETTLSGESRPVWQGVKEKMRKIFHIPDGANLSDIASGICFRRLNYQPIDPRKLTGIITEHAQIRKPRHEAIQQLIKDNPKVTKEKPMLYYASGGDLGSFLSSGIQVAYFVDPIYSKKVKPTDPDSLSFLFASVKNIDNNATLVVDPNNPLYGTICFQHDNQRKTIFIRGIKAEDYTPECLDYSLYANLGWDIEKYSAKPPVKAQAYSISLSFPSVFGYGEIKKTQNRIETFCFQYRENKLTGAESQAALLINLQSFFYHTWFRTLQQDDISALRTNFSQILRMPTKRLPSNWYEQGVKKLLRPIDAFSQDYRRLLLQDILSMFNLYLPKNSSANTLMIDQTRSLLSELLEQAPELKDDHTQRPSRII